MLRAEQPPVSSGSSTPSPSSSSPPPPKRRPGRPRKGSSIEHPIEIDSVPKTQRAAVDKKKEGRSKKPSPALSPALSQSPGSSSGSSSGSRPSVTQGKGSLGPIQSFSGHPLGPPGGILPPNLQQYPQAVPSAANPYYQQPAQLQAPGACGLPSAGLSFNECLNPGNGVNLVDLDPEQIVCGWLENWQSRGLLNSSIEGFLFRRHA